MACDELVLWFLPVICLTEPVVEFMLDRLVILPVEELAPLFCFPFELLVVCTRLAYAFWPVADVACGAGCYCYSCCDCFLAWATC